MNGKLEYIKVNRHYGRFYEIGERFIYEGKRYIILEHETFGNDVDWVVIEAENDTGIYEAVEDEDIIELAYSIV